jgi:hypothetical protein
MLCNWPQEGNKHGAAQQHSLSAALLQRSGSNTAAGATAAGVNAALSRSASTASIPTRFITASGSFAPGEVSNTYVYIYDICTYV